jgi:hypothetical protein
MQQGRVSDTIPTFGKLEQPSNTTLTVTFNVHSNKKTIKCFVNQQMSYLNLFICGDVAVASTSPHL